MCRPVRRARGGDEPQRSRETMRRAMSSPSTAPTGGSASRRTTSGASSASTTGAARCCSAAARTAWCTGSPPRSAGAAVAPRSTLAEGVELCAGDRIRWARSDRGLCLVNSQIEQVTAANDGRVTFRPKDGRTLAVNVGDPQLRHIDRAWALTVHAFQGRTVDNVIAAIEANHPNLGAAIGEHFITERARGGHPARSVAARSRSRMARRGDRALRPVLGGADRSPGLCAGEPARDG